ncbi:MAG: flavin reductase (DIM6/NTAB) family NADH-FMN oxidoreductase RutF [Gammaproteobacteria bacterium]|jgi:flavin reductase (DIM6/NTAB) family NADH-FMN oxidoreductase RutF
MFFNPLEVGMKPAPFKHTVYNALVMPRPIGWISTIGADGVINLAPFSFFNSLSANPPCVMYCPNSFKPGTSEQKDSLINVEATGEFVFSMCTYELREQMIITAAHSPSSVDEMAQAGVEAAPSINVKPPRVKASPIAMECKLLQIVDLPAAPDGARNNVVIGQVVGIHVADEVICDGIIDVKKLNPLARLGYLDYATLNLDSMFSLQPPGGDARFAPRAD